MKRLKWEKNWENKIKNDRHRIELVSLQKEKCNYMNNKETKDFVYFCSTKGCFVYRFHRGRVGLTRTVIGEWLAYEQAHL